MFNAYVIAFGGLLLLGGRLSDLLGARKVFVAGWSVLIAGSVVAAAATTAWVEAAGRAVQGVGGALIAPASMTLLMMLFGRNSKELGKALALYGAAAPAGGTAGVFLGGVFTEWVSWPWVFIIYVPIGIATPSLTSQIDESELGGEVPVREWSGSWSAPRLRLHGATFTVEQPQTRDPSPGAESSGGRR